MDLTDNEKRDAIKLIEAGKPLPDKYRFLLFDDLFRINVPPTFLENLLGAFPL